MSLSIRKTISAKPWLIVGAAYLVFVAVSLHFVVLAVKHKPREVERVDFRHSHAGGAP